MFVDTGRGTRARIFVKRRGKVEEIRDLPSTVVEAPLERSQRLAINDGLFVQIRVDTHASLLGTVLYSRW